MGSSIPDYGLKDKYGNQIFSRNPRFNHTWYAAKRDNIYDNDVGSDRMRITTIAKVDDLPGPFVFFGAADAGLPNILF